MMNFGPVCPEVDEPLFHAPWERSALALTLASTPTPTGPVAVVAGDTWRFQAWHRDTAGGVATSNFTDGVAVTFQ